MKLNEIKRYTLRHLFDEEMGTDSMEVYSEFHDFVIPWINNNNRKVIDRAIKRKDFTTLSKLLLFKYLELKHTRYFDPVDKNAFASFLKKPISIWRGGGGKYDTSKIKGWSSFTADRNRADTFSVYDGTFGKKFLDKRQGPHWIVELQITPNELLLFIDHGGDAEVIIPAKVAERAKVIKQT